MKRRPTEACHATSRFYLQPIIRPKSEIWFMNSPLGKNSIGKIAKKMFETAGLDANGKTNHSGRKSAIQALLHAGIAPTEVQQLSGHKNVQSLNAYATLSLEQQRKLSNILTKTICLEDNISTSDCLTSSSTESNDACTSTSLQSLVPGPTCFTSTSLQTITTIEPPFPDDDEQFNTLVDNSMTVYDEDSTALMPYENNAPMIAIPVDSKLLSMNNEQKENVPVILSNIGAIHGNITIKIVHAKRKRKHNMCE